jgi:hypothetical protein
MRRLSGFLLAAVMLVLPALSHSAFAQAQPPFLIEGESAVLMVSVNAAKTADYEQVLNKLKEVLAKSEAPEAKQQAAGWKVVKTPKPQADGSLIYLHFINPVKGANYSVLQVIYTIVKDPVEQKALYDLYVGSGFKTLSLLYGDVALDLGK